MLQATIRRPLLCLLPNGLRSFASSSASSLNDRVISVSEPVIDRGSIFVGRAARVSATDEVEAVLDEIMKEKKVAKASHPAMYAWRCGVSPSVVQQGKSDGGESGAGAVLAHLLESMDTRDVVVVCTRWYGGSALGPARFRHISSTAREALRLGGFDGSVSSTSGGAPGGKPSRRKKGR